MKRTILAAATVVFAMALAAGADAQGLVRGAQDGAATGRSVAGPVGGMVGAGVGAGVGAASGAVKGVLGIPQDTRVRRYKRRTYYRNGRRYYR